MWALARVEEVMVDPDNHVRKVKLRIADSNLDKNGKRIHSVKFLERPIHKLVVLVEASDVTD